MTEAPPLSCRISLTFVFLLFICRIFAVRAVTYAVLRGISLAERLGL